MKRLAALVLVLLICFSITGCKEETLTAEYAVYMSGGVNGGEIYYTDFRSEPFQITNSFSTTLCTGVEDITLSSRTTISGDNIFYYDNSETFATVLAGSATRGTLYYRSLSDRKAAPVKIDDNVIAFILNDEGNLITYYKYENKKLSLYQHNLTTSALIAESVSGCYPNAKGDSITYLTESQELYVFENGVNTKIAESVKTLKGFGEKEKALCYYSNNTLYMLSGKTSTPVDTNVAFVEQAYLTGECYYLKKSVNQLTLMDFVEDSKISSPFRAELRTTNPSTLFYYTLYYFNGSESVALAENVVLSSLGMPVAETPVICFTTYSLDESDKILISEISSISAAQEAVKGIITAATEKQVAVKDKAYSLPTNAEDYAVAPAGDTVYYYCDKTSTYDLSDVYSASLLNGEMGEPEVYEKQISNKLIFEKNGQVGYYKGGAFYLDKVKIADNVYNYSLNTETGGMSIMQSYDEESKMGTVCHMMEGRPEVLSTGATQHIMLKDRVLYIKNGEALYLHIEGEEREIAKAAKILLAK